MELCAGCGKEPIQNKKYKLGPKCMKARKDPEWEIKAREKQQQQQIKMREKASLKREQKSSSTPPQPKKRVKGISNKEQGRKKLLHEVYASIDEERDQVCTGCGRSDVPLSHSHIISRHFGKLLEADPRNIVYDCLSMGGRKGCHDIWEHGSIQEKMRLLNYEERMSYISEVRPDLWHKLKNRKEEVISDLKNQQ